MNIVKVFKDFKFKAAKTIPRIEEADVAEFSSLVTILLRRDSWECFR